MLAVPITSQTNSLSLCSLRAYFINFGCRTWFGSSGNDAEPEKNPDKKGEAEQDEEDEGETSKKKRKVDEDEEGKKDTIYARLAAPLRLPVKRMIRRN